MFEIVFGIIVGTCWFNKGNCISRSSYCNPYIDLQVFSSIACSIACCRQTSILFDMLRVHDGICKCGDVFVLEARGQLNKS